MWPWSTPAADPERWVVLDVETTGLNPSRDALLAIAGVALHWRDGRLSLQAADSFEVVVRHEGGTIDRDNILIHGIGVGQQRRGVAPPQALQAFEAWCGRSARIGYHVAFDRAVLERACRQAGVTRPRARWIDLAPLASLVQRDRPGRALDDWLEHFGIPCAQRHQAAADVLATAELLLRLWPALRRQGIDGVAALERLERQAFWVTRNGP